MPGHGGARADILLALPVVYNAIIQNSGQTCISIERAYVEAPVYDAFVSRVTEKVRALRQGEPTAPGTVDVGAMTFPKQVGIVQSLLVTCRLHGIDPYSYLVDVLQRVSELPQSRVAELTPRLWKQNFSANPMRSVLHGMPR